MPRKKSLQPGYRFHVSGQARVELDGRTYYLGKHGSPESWAKYHALVADYLAGGMSARDTTPAETVEHLAEQAVQIRHVTADFRARELPLHESNTGSFYRFKKALESLEHRHGNMGIRGQAPFDLQSIFLGKPCLSPIPFPPRFHSVPFCYLLSD